MVSYTYVRTYLNMVHVLLVFVHTYVHMYVLMHVFMHVLKHVLMHNITLMHVQILTSVHAYRI